MNESGFGAKIVSVGSISAPSQASMAVAASGGEPGNMAFAERPMPSSAQQLAADAGTVSTAFDVSGQIGQFAATFSTQEILGKSSTIPSDLQVEIATTGVQDSSEIVHELQGANSEAAQSLASAAEAYGPALKWMEGVGWVATAAEGVADVANAAPGQRVSTAGAAITNTAGSYVSTEMGAEVGAEVGVPFAPFTFGLSVPIGALVGGISGYFAYKAYVAPAVQEGWTGVKPSE